MMKEQKYKAVHYYWLDLMRILSALMVLLHHYRSHLFVPYPELQDTSRNILVKLLYSSSRFSHEAVLIFFVLSGFLVGGVGIAKIRSNVFSTRRYVIDRTVRISLPLVVNVLYFIILSLVILGEDIDWYQVSINLLSLQGVLASPLVVPLWSLAYEVWFYILFGALAVIMLSSSGPIVRFMGKVMLLIGFMVFLNLEVYYLFIWALGALAFQHLPHKVNKVWLTLSVIGMVVMAALLQLTDGSEVYNMNITAPIRQSLEMLFAVCVCVFIRYIILVKPKGRIMIAVNAIGETTAKFSYTLYLSHMITYEALIAFGFTIYDEVNATSFTQYVIALSIALAVAYLLYLVGEKHTAKVKRVISSKSL